MGLHNDQQGVRITGRGVAALAETTTLPQRCIGLDVQIEGERYGELAVGHRCSTKIMEIQRDGSSIYTHYPLYRRFGVQIWGKDMGRLTGECGRLNVA
jgi:hypothetical protein